MNTLVDNLKAFFTKKDLDFKSNITLREFHPQIFVVLSINGIFFNNKHSKWRFVYPTLCTMLSILATVVEVLAFVHCIQTDDTAGFTAAFAYTVIIAVIPFLYFCIARATEKIYQLIEVMDRDFKNMCALGDPYRSKFFEGQLIIWQCGWAWCSTVSVVGGMYIILSIVALICHNLFITQTEDSTRPLIFPVWFPYGIDAYSTPYYEVMFVCMISFVIIFGTSFCGYVYVIFHVLLHCYFLIDMVIIGLKKLFDGLEDDSEDLETSLMDDNTKMLVLKSRIKRIVKWHCTIFDLVVATIDGFGLVLAYQIVLSSVVICLMAFYMTVQIKQGTIDICVSLLMVGALLQLWIPCYISSQLRTKGFEVADACFYSGWNTCKLHPLVKIDLQMIIIRAQKPITMQISCLPVICLETFSSIMSTAYSYFNMMQQR